MAATLPPRLKLPETVEEVDHVWLAAALAPAFPGRTLLAAKADLVIPGTATKILMTLDFSAFDEGGAPVTEKICVKGAFDPVIRGYNLGTIFACEAAFYRDVGTRLDITLPRCFYADDDGVFGVLVLENLLERGARFVEVTASWSPGRAAGLLDILARLHAFSWDWKPGVLPWLQGSDALRNGILGMAAADKFPALIERPQVAAHLPAPLADRATWLAALQALWDRDDGQPLCLGHGDAHLGQTYIDGDGSPGLLDWQCAGLMPWAKDVAYFLGGALSIEDRRAHERSLIDHYLSALEAAGGPHVDREKAWDDYRRQMLQGICWTMVTEQMQPLTAITVMNERYLTAIDDLGTLDLVEAKR